MENALAGTLEFCSLCLVLQSEELNHCCGYVAVSALFYCWFFLEMQRCLYCYVIRHLCLYVAIASFCTSAKSTISTCTKSISSLFSILWFIVAGGPKKDGEVDDGEEPEAPEPFEWPDDI